MGVRRFLIWAGAMTAVAAGELGAGPAIAVSRHAWLRGETAVVTATGMVPGSVLVLQGKGVPGSWRLKPGADGSVALDTGQYRTGDYELIARREKEVLASLPLYIRPAERPALWFGNFIARPMRGGANPMEELAELGMNAAYSYGTDPDEALRQGVYLVHHGNAYRNAGKGLTPEDLQPLQQLFLNCKGTKKRATSLCMRNPDVIRRAGDHIVSEMTELVRHSAAMGVGLDDEISMRHYDWNDSGAVTCFCDSCRRQWKAKTGQALPRPPSPEPGTVFPDDHPYVRYMLEWTGWGDYYGPAEADYNRALLARLREVDKDLVVFQTPGAAFGELDAVHWETYTYWFCSPPTAALADVSWVNATQRVTAEPAKPVWPLIGWFQRRPAPAWTGPYIGAQSRMCLAEGADAIWLTIMFWYRSRGGHMPTMFHEAEHVKPHIRQLGRMLERYGPTLVRVEPVRYPVAVLFSRTTLGLLRVIDPQEIAAAKARGSWMEQPWEHGQATSMGFGALLKAGVPCEFITETDIDEGRLDRYGAVVLLDHKYARQSVVDKLTAFAASGKPVFADRSSAVRPETATVMPIDATQVTRMINLGLRTARVGGKRLEIVMNRMTGLEDEWAFLLRPFVEESLPDSLRVTASDNPDVIVRMGENGRTRYVFALSADVRNRQSALITARCGGRFAYDLTAGTPVAHAVLDGVLTAPVTIEPGDWKVFVVTAEPMADLALSAVNGDGAVKVRASVVDGQGNPIEGAFPIRLEALGPKAAALPYGGYMATEGGTVTHAFVPATNDPKGTWTVRATNLVTGQSTETGITPAR